MLHRRFRLSLALGAFAVVSTMIAADVADARGRVSIGSRGTRTNSAPPATTTAPTARPIERSTTQPGVSAAPRPVTPAASTQGRAPVQVSPVIVAPGRSGQQQQQASAANAQPVPAASPPGFTGGFLGAGLFGLLLGAGLTGGLGSLASFLGLALQIAIIAAIAWALMGLLQGRGQTATEVPARDLHRPAHSRSTFGLRNAAPR